MTTQRNTGRPPLVKCAQLAISQKFAEVRRLFNYHFIVVENMGFFIYTSTKLNTLDSYLFRPNEFHGLPFIARGLVSLRAS